MESPKEERQSESAEEPHTLKIKNLRRPESALNVATVVLGAGVLIVYFFQWIAMRDTIDLTRKTAERESRAFVKIAQDGKLQTIPEQTIELPLRVTNVGKTPARNIVVATVVEVVPRAQAPNFGDSPTDIIPIFRSEVGDLFPNDWTSFNTWRLKAKGEAKKGGDTEVWPLSKPEYAELMAGQAYIAVHGQIGYEDIYHVPHWTKFCYWWPFTSLEYNASECVGRNTTDNADEP
jgi:hypothetical protein